MRGNPVAALWELMEQRRWDEATGCLADDCVVVWPQTGERFTSRESFMAMNRAHPAPNWHVRSVRTVTESSLCAAESIVDTDDGTDVCIGFYRLRDGLIQTATEYWVSERSAERPPWREGMSDLIGDTPEAASSAEGSSGRAQLPTNKPPA